MSMSTVTSLDANGDYMLQNLDYAALHPGYGTDSLADDYKDVIGRIESGTEIETQ
jgi:hypothetical protein